MMNGSEIIKLSLIISLLLNGGLWYLMYGKIKTNVKKYSHALVASKSSLVEKVRVKRLTDVVIPLPPKHFHKVEKLLERWEELWPCYDPSDDLDSTKDLLGDVEFYKEHGHRLGHDVTLTFFVSCTVDATLEAKLLALFDSLPLRCRRCFQRARVHFADLSGEFDTYWYGTTLMFERMLLDRVGLKWPQYVLYMEPDLLPIRKYWLTALDFTTREPSPSFWVKGSLFKGHPFLKSVLVVPLNMHINGNAIYNLNDPIFKEFYFDRVYNLSRADPTNNHAYDLDIYLYLTYPGNIERVAPLGHKFQYTELIQNYYHTEYSVAQLREKYPNAYLVHGGTMIP